MGNLDKSALQSGPIKPYVTFLNSVTDATNETAIRELFMILAATGFQNENFATNLALSAERSVAFSRRGLIRRGRIDSFIDNAIVEFKLSLTDEASRQAAREQLAGYVAGAWAEDGSYRRPYLAVATDGLHWLIYTPLVVSIEHPPQDGLASNVNLVLVENWPPSSEAADPHSLRTFLNRLFFRVSLLPPTPENFARDFGLDSPAFLAISETLQRKADELSNSAQMLLYENSWWADLQVAYGNLKDTGELFIRHTYLALLARLLVWTTLERRPATEIDLRGVFNKSYFMSRRIGNLVEDDYFAWHSLKSETDLTPVWKALVSQLASYKLDDVAEDVLKPLYEELVDPEARHELGEYYTPDWLASAVVDRLVTGWNMTDRGTPVILDPACGSGSFLRASIHRIRNEQSRDLTPQQQLRDVIQHVHGMDVHPLAVIIAKATYLLAIADLIADASSVVNIPVYLCNSISGKRATQTSSLFGDLVELEVGQGENRRAFKVPVEFVSDGATYDEAIGEVIDSAKSIGGSRTAARHGASAIRRRVSKRLSSFPQSEILVESLANMCVHLAELIKRGEDSIYGFLLRNRYRSTLLRNYFDLVVGNPPWLTIADFSPGRYRDQLLERNDELKIAPRRAGEQAHTEIATIFLAHAASHFLASRDDDFNVTRIGFVLPRSIMSATHHRLLRTGDYDVRLDVTELWDLDGVVPLFNIPACVLFGARRPPRPHASKLGRVYRGRLALRDPSADSARQRLTVTSVSFGLKHLGRRSAWAVIDEDDDDEAMSAARRMAAQAAAEGVKAQHYASHFRQGAILYPQVLLIVDLVGASSSSVTAGPVTVRTSEVAAASAHLLADLRWQNVVDAESLHYTISADHLLPYGLRAQPWIVVLPVVTTPRDADFSPVSPDELRRNGFVYTADWLDEVEDHWESVRKSSEKRPIWERVNYLGHLTAQAGRARYVVVYSASGSRAATVIDTDQFSRPFVFRDKTYWAAFEDEREAHYLCAFLNSDYAEHIVAAFATRGLFGQRDVHKRILDVPWPTWNASNERHRELAQCSVRAAEKVRAFLPELPLSVGRARSAVRRSLDYSLRAEIDRLVEEISSSEL